MLLLVQQQLLLAGSCHCYTGISLGRPGPALCSNSRSVQQTQQHLSHYPQQQHSSLLITIMQQWVAWSGHATARVVLQLLLPLTAAHTRPAHQIHHSVPGRSCLLLSSSSWLCCRLFRAAYSTEGTGTRAKHRRCWKRTTAFTQHFCSSSRCWITLIVCGTSLV